MAVDEILDEYKGWIKDIEKDLKEIFPTERLEDDLAQWIIRAVEDVRAIKNETLKEMIIDSRLRYITSELLCNATRKAVKLALERKKLHKKIAGGKSQTHKG